MAQPWHLYFMALCYLLAGMNHFRTPRLYLKIIPPHIPKPQLINILVGVVEIGLAVALCIPSLTAYAAWGIILLLLAVFPANIYMYQNEKASLGLSLGLRLWRLPLQLLLIFWAIQYTTFYINLNYY